jgi:hypothetical protein
MREYTSTDVLVGNAFHKLAVASDWLELASGANTLSFTPFSFATNQQVQFRYRDTYM